MNIKRIFSCNNRHAGATVAIIIALLFALDVLGKPTFVVETSGNGRPVILIPGLGCSGNVWASTASQLNVTGFETHTITIAGFAGIEAPDTTSLAILSSEIAGYVKKLDKPVVLIGHSMGGVIGLMIAGNHPDLLSKLIIVDALPFLPAAMNPAATVESVKPQAQMLTQFTINQTDQQFREVTRSTLKGMIADTSWIADVLQWNVASDRRIFTQMTLDLMTTDLRPTLSRIPTPTLILGAWAAGKKFGMTKEMGEQIYSGQYRELTNGRVVMADKAFHFIMLDEPQWMMDQINQFIQ